MARKPKAPPVDLVDKPTAGAHALKTFAELVSAVEQVVDYRARRSTLRPALKRARRALARIGVDQ